MKDADGVLNNKKFIMGLAVFRVKIKFLYRVLNASQTFKEMTKEHG